MHTIWEQRWDALDSQLQEMMNSYGRSSHPLIKNSLHALTESLRAFGQDQFRFFWDGFDSEQLLPSMHLPEEHVLRATLDQVAFDMGMIQHIAYQRQQTTQETLEKADKLAQMALNVAINSSLLSKCTVLTYFNKSVNIRLIPYAPLALIGIPFSAAKANSDLLAIPHEVGHYVYHHAPGLAAQLHARIPLYPDWINHWIEEIFADLYGALVAGPVTGLSFQEILLDNAQEKFVADNGKHPPDAIRPFGYTHSLRQLGYTQAADALDTKWAEMLGQRHYPTEFVPNDGTTPASLTQARELIEQTAVIFLNYLQQDRQVNQPTPWSNDSSDLTTLYPDFAIWLTQTSNVDLYQLKSFGENIGLVQGNGQPQNVRRKGSTQTWRDWIKAESRQNPDTLLPAQAWVPVFTAGHWPVEGPESNSDGGV
jgi:hypothetical protein